MSTSPNAVGPFEIRANSMLELKALLAKKPLLKRDDDIQKELAALTIEDKIAAADVVQELYELDQADLEAHHAQVFVLAREKAKTTEDALCLLNFHIIAIQADKNAFRSAVNLALSKQVEKAEIAASQACQIHKPLKQLLDTLVPDTPKKSLAFHLF